MFDFKLRQKIKNSDDSKKGKKLIEYILINEKWVNKLKEFYLYDEITKN